MYEIDYIKKPSIVTLKAAIKKAIKAGATFIVLRWGENQITLEQGHGYTTFAWLGRGWIGRNGGQDLANDLNRATA